MFIKTAKNRYSPKLHYICIKLRAMIIYLTR